MTVAPDFRPLRITWTLMAAHGMVLFYLAANPRATMRQAASDLDLTERRVFDVVKDLEGAGLLTIRRHGRRNSYEIRDDAHFMHPTLSHIRLGRFVELLCSELAGPASPDMMEAAPKV